MQQPSELDSFKYWAFISYSHQDKTWGDWLHKGLETYRVPKKLVGSEGFDGPVPKRAFPVFRDREELPGSSDLGENISDALNQSRYLVVICSPRSARSIWVNEEIKSFIAIGKINKIVCLLVDGEPFSSTNECLPHALCSLPQQDREALNLVRVGSGKQEERNAILEILSRILGIESSQLLSLDRRRSRFQRMASVAAVIFAIAGGMVTWNVVQEKEWNRLKHESLLLAEQSLQQTAAGNTMQGIQQALNALPRSLEHQERPYLIEAEAALFKAVWHQNQSKTFKLEGDQGALRAAHFSADGHHIVTSLKHSWDETVPSDRSTRVWDAETGMVVLRLEGDKETVAKAVFSPDNRKILTKSEDGTVRIWDARSGNTEITVTGKTSGWLSGFPNTFMTPDSRRFVTGSVSGKSVNIWDATSGELQFSFQPSTEIRRVILDPKGTKFVTLMAAPNAPQVWDAQSGERLFELPVQESDVIFTGVFSPTGKTFVAGTQEGVAIVWDITTGKEQGRLFGHEDAISDLLFIDSERKILTGSKDGTARIWDITSGNETVRFKMGAGSISSVHISPDQRTALATSLLEDTVTLWDVETGVPLLNLDSANGFGEFSSDGKKLVTISAINPQTAIVWQMLPRGDELISLAKTLLSAP